ncbi:hypothetical protein [Rhodopila sp.]|uniref:hypothetical protein n=1 Tax=Rhodopila sp. TaxID=2480087 RepID=UPI003D1356F8
MDMESLKALSDDWFQWEELGFATRKAIRVHKATLAEAMASEAKELQPVPMLNWPPTLFDDVVPHH